MAAKELQLWRFEGDEGKQRWALVCIQSARVFGEWSVVT
ncbi:unnamed protein product [Camellia sinensis]